MIPSIATPQDPQSERRSRETAGTGVPHGRRLFSHVLLSSALVSREQLLAAIEATRGPRASLPDAVVRLGFVSEIDSYAALCRVAGIPIVDLADVILDDAVIMLLPERVARAHSALPLRVEGKTLICAVPRPFDDQASRDIAFATGLQPKLILACRSQIEAAIDRVHGHRPRAPRPLVSDARLATPDAHPHAGAGKGLGALRRFVSFGAGMILLLMQSAV